jgi:hypothetical protein
MQGWRERTSADITFTYQGTTTNTLNAECLDPQRNGVNEIYMYPGCREPACTTFGLSRAHLAAGDPTTTVEDDRLLL